MINEQKKIFEVIKNALNNNKLSHAYLIDTNNFSNYKDVIISICKLLLCDNDEYFCNNCSTCIRIDHENHTDVKIIKPDGSFIKKEQILELQDNFSKTSIEGKKRIYVIFECERMNKYTANSLLKFLEEPFNDVIAILVTNNVNSVLPTIKSRCQNLKLLSNNCNNELSTIDKLKYLISDNNIEDDNLIIKYIELIKFYEENGLDLLIKFDNYFNFKKVTKNEITLFFDILINFYYDIILLKKGQAIKYFNDYVELLNLVSNLNEEDKILNKLKLLIEYKEYIKFNVNIHLLLDSLFINFEGGRNGNSGN